jgi:hypothetical protein
VNNKDNNDLLDWFSSEFNARILVSPQRMHRIEPFNLTATQMVESSIVRERVFDVAITERDLLHIARCLRERVLHDSMRRRYRAVEEAWVNYMATLYLSRDAEDDRYF